MIKFLPVAIIVSMALSGCANLANNTGSGERGIDGVACVGSVATSVEGLSDAGNSPLLAKAQMQTGKGGVCSAKAFSVSAPVVLYRVFDESKPYTKFGGWWSLNRPGNSKPEYRAANAICPEWSNLNRLVSCEIRPGTQIVLGTTQSAECADGSTYPKTAETQVFVANDGRAGIIHVGACGEETSWP
ncbi:MAG: hypothetical protein V4772_05595 [Pseudomonadota bacterium]